MSFKKLTIEAIVKAETQKVWESWTQPQHITKWNFASDDWCCPRASNDLKVGGKYSARMEAKDGSFGFDFEVIYDEVQALKKITYTIPDGRQATTTFENLGGATKVITVFDAENTHPPEMQQQGWQSILNNFKKYVESY
jgi:uncharacterized protein YndB with AHSA1/START domain